MGTILFNFCITCAAKCMIKSHWGIIFVVICFIQLIYYMFMALTIIINDFRWLETVLEITTAIIVIKCLSNCYQLYKLIKPSNEKVDNSINKNLLEEQNNASSPPQVMQQPPQVMQPHSQFVQPTLQPHPLVNNVNPNHGYYPGPPMNSMYDNNYINQNNAGYNI